MTSEILGPCVLCPELCGVVCCVLRGVLVDKTRH
jgi:hypothetical protein